MPRWRVMNPSRARHARRRGATSSSRMPRMRSRMPRELLVPEGAQFGVVEDRRRRPCRRASAGWNSWCARALQLTERARRLVGARRDELKRADALAVERKRLGEGARDEDRLASRLRRRARRPVGVDAVGEPWYAMSRKGMSPRDMTTSRHLRPTARASGRRRSGCGSRRAARRCRRPESPAGARASPRNCTPLVAGS